MWSIFTVKTSKLAVLCFFAKVVPEKVLFIDKKFFDQNFWKKSVFESFFVQRVIFWIKNFKSVKLRAIFLQLDDVGIENLERVRFRKESFTTRQISEWKCFVKKHILVKVWLSENPFCTLIHCENAKLCSYALSKKPQISERNGNKTVLLSKLLKRIRFWNNFLTTR